MEIVGSGRVAYSVTIDSVFYFALVGSNETFEIESNNLRQSLKKEWKTSVQSQTEVIDVVKNASEDGLFVLVWVVYLSRSRSYLQVNSSPVPYCMYQAYKAPTITSTIKEQFEAIGQTFVRHPELLDELDGTFLLFIDGLLQSRLLRNPVEAWSLTQPSQQLITVPLYRGTGLTAQQNARITTHRRYGQWQIVKEVATFTCFSRNGDSLRPVTTEVLIDLGADTSSCPGVATAYNECTTLEGDAFDVAGSLPCVIAGAAGKTAALTRVYGKFQVQVGSLQPVPLTSLMAEDVAQLPKLQTRVRKPQGPLLLGLDALMQMKGSWERLDQLTAEVTLENGMIDAESNMFTGINSLVSAGVERAEEAAKGLFQLLGIE